MSARAIVNHVRTEGSPSYYKQDSVSTGKTNKSLNRDQIDNLTISYVAEDSLSGKVELKIRVWAKKRVSLTFRRTYLARLFDFCNLPRPGVF